MTSKLWQSLLSVVLLAGMLLAVPSAQAQRPRGTRNNRCAQRIRQAENNLQKAIQRHGPRSRQAAQRRRQLDQVREHCGAL